MNYATLVTTNFARGDVMKGNYINKLTTNRYIITPNINSTKAAYIKIKEL